MTASGIAQWNGTAWEPLIHSPYVLTTSHLLQPNDTTRRTDLNYRTTRIVKVGADNTAGTFFRVTVGNTANRALRIQENPSNASTGAAAEAAGYLGPLTVTASAVKAVYTHPAFVDASSPHKDLHLELLDTTVPTAPVVLATYPMQVVRPPLLLVHGLWSNGDDAFPGLRNRLVANGLYGSSADIRYADYANDQEFTHNAQAFSDHVKAHLQAAAGRNISVSKVDIIGHSMGGILPRRYIQGSAYRYDVNKLITLNTPHSGSPLPNFINWLPAFGRDGLTAVLRYGGMDPGKGAVQDLSYNGPAMGLLNDNGFPNTKGVAVHTVSTNIVLSPALPVQQLLNGQYSWGGLIAGYVALTNPKAALGMNGFLTGSMFRSDHDLIVGTDSQMGGLAAPYTSSITAQAHIASGGNPAVQTQLEFLLRATTQSSGPFTTTGFRPSTTVSSYFPRLSPAPAVSTAGSVMARSSTTLQITSPTRGALITDTDSTRTDSVQVTVTASADVTRIVLVCSANTAELTTRLLEGTGGTVKLKLPQHGMGRLKIAALAFTDSVCVQYDTLSTRLTTNATLQSLRLAPRSLYTTAGDSTLLQVLGTYSDGFDRNLLGQPGLQLTFAVGGKARIGHDGMVLGLAPGRDTLRVSYAGRTDRVPVEVGWPKAQVLSFSPASGGPSTTVTITGANLPDAEVVSFNGMAARFAVDSPTQLTVTVPDGATSGLISVITPAGASSSSGSFTISPLPVTLTSFTAKAQGAAVGLAWQTASEHSSAYFAVERSADGRAFEVLAQVPAQGHSLRPTAYAYRDAAAPFTGSSLYYRLRLTDTDGSATYSPVQNVALSAAAHLTLHPNPTHGLVTVCLPTTANARPLQVIDVLGREVWQTQVPARTETVPLNLAGLPAGVYTVRYEAFTARLEI